MEIFYLPASDIAPWVPFATSPYFIEDYLGNHILNSRIVPEANEYKMLDHAILRARLRYAAKNIDATQLEAAGAVVFSELVSVSDAGLVLLPALLKSVSDTKEAVQIILDGLEPSSTPIYSGEGDHAKFLCYAVCFEGEMGGQITTEETVKVLFATGRVVDIPVRPDSLTWCLADPQEAHLEFNLVHATINSKKSDSLPIAFGEMGIIIDSRGRPFTPPDVNEDGRKRLERWLTAREAVRLL